VFLAAEARRLDTASRDVMRRTLAWGELVRDKAPRRGSGCFLEHPGNDVGNVALANQPGLICVRIVDLECRDLHWAVFFCILRLPLSAAR
jgi:hypothetical protein